MRQEGSDSNNSTTGVRLGSDRAAQVATENQAGAKPEPIAGFGSVAGWALPSVVFEGPVIPALAASSPAANQITDCSKDKCIVDGKQYTNSTDIPGNHPKLLLHPDGKPVMDPEGKPVFGPDGIDIEKIALDARAHRNWTSVPSGFVKFAHSGKWDFQRRMTDDIPGVGARPIFTKEYQNFTSIAAGYILGSLGASAHDIGFYGNIYCWARNCNYQEPRAKEFPYIGERHWQDFEIGIRLWKESHPQLANNSK